MDWIEITTQIGCVNMCSYCPQELLINTYRSAKKRMNFEDFSLLIKNIDKDTGIIFSGFSEVFMNPDSVEMINYAYCAGHEIILYTTLVGITENKIKQMEGIKFYEVCFHEYPNCKKEKFDYQVELFKDNTFSKQGFRIVTISEPISRSGNCWRVPLKSGKISCRENRLSNNILLPNGDVYICCMDFGLKHKIGNLFETHYKDMDPERDNIRQLMTKENSDVLCRTCETSEEN